MATENMELNDIMFAALDHGISSIVDAAGPLIPLAITKKTNGDATLNRFVTERLEDGLKEAWNFVSENKRELTFYAVAWDGYITVDNKKWDAILVEAGSKDNKSGFLLAQRYEMVKSKNQPVGNAALIEKPDSKIYVS